MKKLILGLAITSALGLAGCSDSPKEPEIPDGTAGSGGGGSTALTRATFNIAEGNIPLPNDLLFSGTTNLTIAVPEEDELLASDPLLAVGGLDGWSSIAPITISFNNEQGTDIQPGTIVPGSTVKMYKVDVVRPEIDPVNAPGVIAPTGPVVGATELVAGVDYVAAYAAPLTAAVIPLKPLEQQASYMVVVTNGVTDANGNPAITDGQYAIVQGEVPIPEGTSTSALEPVRLLVNAMENAAQAAGQDKSEIILSLQFTVQSMGTTMEAAKGLYVDLPFSLGVLPATSFTPLNLPSNLLNPALSGDALISVGQIDLNYMLEAPTSVEDTTNVVNGYWKAAEMVPVGGNMVPNPRALDDLTYANPLPNVNSIETAPLLVSLPSNDLCPTPYPVMIFQHGITSNRTAMLGIADTMANICTAVVSMDMPLHGVDESVGAPIFVGYNGFETGGLRERTFGVDLVDNETGAPHQVAEDFDGPDGSGAHTINLQNLRASRDNVRQAIFDLLTLEKAIPGMDVNGDLIPDFDPTKVYFMGHSLGGIVGSTFVAKSDLVSAAVLANPGSGIARLLDASETFGPRIRAGLAAAGIDSASAEYQLFLLATQTVVDSGDPANYAMEAVTRETPVPTLLFRVAGDSVVPNNVATAPLSGTDPLAALLGLQQVSATEPGETVVGTRLQTRLNQGTHSTVLLPDVPAATVEMQTQIATFLSSGGQAIQVVDPTLLD